MAEFLDLAMDPTKKMDWGASASMVCAPLSELEKIPAVAIAEMKKCCGLLWVRSSGTTRVDEQRWVGLERNAFLISARNVCEHYSINSHDILFVSLPRNHVGGLAIEARAHVSGAKLWFPRDAKWHPSAFVEEVAGAKITVVSLVPTQIFDLVSANLHSPQSLRIVFVGGGALSGPLAKKAKELGWPIEVTYGSTEMSSMIARAEWQEILNHWSYHVLPGNRIEVQADATARIFGPGLFKKELRLSGERNLKSPEIMMTEPPQDQFGNFFWASEDVFEEIPEHQGLLLLGRRGDAIKISGELVSLMALRDSLEKILLLLRVPGKAVLLSNKHLRLENEIVMVAEYSLYPHHHEILEKLANEVRKFERPHRIFWVDRVPVTGIGKIWYSKLIRDLRLT